MTGRAFRSTAMCLCFCSAMVHAWNDMLPPVQFLQPKHVGGLLKSPTPIFEILKKPPPFEELKGPILEHLHQARACCEAMTAQCIACSKGMRTEDLCRRTPFLPGCNGHGNGPRPGIAPPGIPAMATQEMPPLPLKDMLKEAVIAAGGKSDAARLVEDVGQYVDRHPGALENATKTALKGLSTVFSRSHADKVQAATAAPVALPAVDGSVAVPPVPAVEEPAFDRRWIENPWIIAGIATATASACTGIAVGVLCFARIQRVRVAREPLLAGGQMPSSLSDTTITV
mmetsp:Transcript_65877/g.129854  ORF Transcript_65877/g.129854 Transcript_65877/m.129854 type:complete len:285 (+) Transcript_65877:88-942(+)